MPTLHFNGSIIRSPLDSIIPHIRSFWQENLPALYGHGTPGIDGTPEYPTPNTEHRRLYGQGNEGVGV